MRFCAGSTAATPVTDQAVSVRRPLRRRLDTIARPARVRILSRKPCTRARRRLFGWKVRLPFATALSSLHLAPWSAPGPPGVGHDSPHEALDGPGVSLLTGAGPECLPGSQPYRRLSGDCSRVLTCLRRVKPDPRPKPTECAPEPDPHRRTSLVSHQSRHVAAR